MNERSSVGDVVTRVCVCVGGGGGGEGGPADLMNSYYTAYLPADMIMIET